MSTRGRASGDNSDMVKEISDNSEFKSILEFDPPPRSAKRHYEIVDHMLLHYDYIPTCFICRVEKMLEED